MEVVRPFVKWAGGKTQLIGQINKYLPLELTDGKIERYIEPFVGGGAVLIDVLQKYDVKSAIAELDSERTVLEVELERRISYANLEVEAMQLGMKKPDKDDVTYIKVNDSNACKIADGTLLKAE